MILGFVSAQFVSLAHACVTGVDAIHAAGGHAASEPSHAIPDCPGMAEGTKPGQSACDGHCLPREQADRTVDARIALAPPAVFVVRVVERVIVPGAVRSTPPRATIASPPLALLFGRFLN